MLSHTPGAGCRHGQLAGRKDQQVLAPLSPDGRADAGRHCRLLRSAVLGARIVWESQHAAIAAARGLRASKASDRITAVRALESVEFQESALAIRAVIPRLLDADPEVRAAAAKALGTLGGAAVKIGSSGYEARAAVSSLTESLKDREAASRIEAATALGTIAGCDPGRVIDLKPLYSALMELLGDGNAEVRAAAIRASASSVQGFWSNRRQSSSRRWRMNLPRAERPPSTPRRALLVGSISRCRGCSAPWKGPGRRTGSLMCSSWTESGRPNSRVRPSLL